MKQFKNFKDYKKALQEKKEREETLRELKGAMKSLESKRENYKKEAQLAMKNGNTSRMNVMIALMKQAMFNLKVTQDMEANYILATDMLEMQSMNKRFVKSLDSIMKNVYKTCKAIHVQSSEKNFSKALYMQTQTSAELKQALESNNMMFANSVSTLSDISDDEVKELLGEGIALEEENEDAQLDELEQAFKGLVNKTQEPKAPIMEAATAKAKPSAPAPKAEAPKPAPAPKAEAPAPKVEAPKAEETSAPAPKVEEKHADPVEEEPKQKSPEDELLEGEGGEGGFVWDNIPTIGFDDIAGLEEVKEVVRVKVLLPLKNPDAFIGYEKKNGGGLCLYGPPGTGKTMIAAAIAKEIGAKFCSVKPSDLLQQGVGNTEKAVKTLFSQARKFPCAVIYFDEMDSISPKNTRSQYAKQLRSEFLAQLQGIESYGKDKGNVLFLICATNKPWDIDSAFLRPGRFGTKVYVGLPDAPAREYMIKRRIDKIKKQGVVEVKEDLNIEDLVEKTSGFNGSDISNLLDRIEEISIIRGVESNEKYICNEDFEEAMNDITSSVQTEDLIKLKEWRTANDK